jgi:hypothetical protein
MMKQIINQHRKAKDKNRNRQDITNNHCDTENKRWAFNIIKLNQTKLMSRLLAQVHDS